MCLNGHVQRGRRLVRDQQSGAADQGHGDHRPLAQPAGQFERIGAQCLGRIGETDQPQHFGRQFHPFGLRDVPVQEQCFGYLIAHRMQRRQRGHRFLEDDGYAPAADCPHVGSVPVQCQQIGDRVLARIVKQNFAAGDLGLFRQNSHDCLGHHGLARPGFADQRHGFARGHAKADAVDGADDTFRHMEFDLEVVDVQ